MMKKIALLTVILLLASCPNVTAQSKVASFHEQNTVECLGVELDGSQTLRATGSGRSKSDAQEQAKKNAVFAVIFKGIRGVGECDQRPLVNEANARDKYAEYFDIFFMDGGEYSKYITLDDQKRRSKDKTKNKYVKNYTITVRVLRTELKARLKADGILK